MRPVSGLRQYDVPSNTTVSQPASASRLLTSPLLMPPPRLRVPSDSSRIHHRRVGCTVGGAPQRYFLSLCARLRVWFQQHLGDLHTSHPSQQLHTPEREGVERASC